ncbi:hypothetical protein WA556_006426, partial [Blastocystis sp. ATCC 50177/Nand II]
TLSAVVSELNPSTAESIRAIEKDGGCFLRCFNSFSDADLLGIISNPSFVEYVKNTIMKAEEESEDLQNVISSLFFCIGSANRDIQCFAVSLTPYILYSYLRAYSEQKSLLSLEVFLQKVLYIESHTTTKKSIVPVFDCPSVVAVGNTSTSLNTNSLQFQQLIEDTDREEVPSELR